MAGRKHTAEQIIAILRQIEVAIGNGKTNPQAFREAGITEQTLFSLTENNDEVVRRSKLSDVHALSINGSRHEPKAVIDERANGGASVDARWKLNCAQRVEHPKTPSVLEYDLKS